MSKRRKNRSDRPNDPEPEDEEANMAQRSLLISAWAARDKLYKDLFGDYTSVSPPSYGPPPISESSAGAFVYQQNSDTGDPGAEDHRLSILSYGPDPLRPYWTYITAGLSSPWLQEKPAEVSGFGCELLIKSPVEASWPAQILRTMAFYIFNHAGTLSPGVRIALNAPIDLKAATQLHNIIIWYADEAPDCVYQLPSGSFGIFAAIGITDDELKFAESVDEYGTWCLEQILRRTGFAQVTDPVRKSVMTHENITEIIKSVTSFADQFRASSDNAG